MNVSNWNGATGYWRKSADWSNGVPDNATEAAFAGPGVKQLGLELFAGTCPGSSVTSITAPPGLDSSVIVKEFRTRFGSVIANGQGSMKGQIFRIAHLGYFDFADLFSLIAMLEIILNANGHKVAYGSGVAAAG